MVFEKLKEIILDEFLDDGSIVTLDSSFAADFSWDELDVADLCMSVEDEFGIEVTWEASENIKTVGDLVKYIEENL